MLSPLAIISASPAPRGPRFVWGFCLGLSLLAQAPEARAEVSEPDQRAAKALFREGLELWNGGRQKEACPLFAQSQKVNPQVGTGLNLANCYKETGKLASAWDAYDQAAGLAHSKGDKREAQAREESRAIEARLGYLVIRGPNTPGLRLTIDGTEVSRGAWVRLPIDAGPHQVKVSAPGKNPQKLVVETRDGTRTEWTVPDLEDAGDTPPSDPSNPAPPAPAAGKRAGPVGEAPFPYRPLALGSGALGLLGLGLGIGFAVDASNKVSDSNRWCNSNNVCQPKGVKLRDEASTSATWGTVGFGIGVLGLAGAALLWFSAPSTPGEASARLASPSDRPRLRDLTLSPSAEGWALSATGTW